MIHSSEEVIAKCKVGWKSFGSVGSDITIGGHGNGTERTVKTKKWLRIDFEKESIIIPYEMAEVLKKSGVFGSTLP